MQYNMCIVPYKILYTKLFKEKKFDLGNGVSKSFIIFFFSLKKQMLMETHMCIHGEKFISKLYYFHKKIHYFFSDAGTHSKFRIFTILNSTF